MEVVKALVVDMVERNIDDREYVYRPLGTGREMG
jgi:hypothetical protein